MNRVELQDLGKLRVGMDVLVVTDSGFQQGIRQKKTLTKIIKVENTPEEASRLQCPLIEYVYVFSDESTASYYDQVTPWE